MSEIRHLQMQLDIQTRLARVERLTLRQERRRYWQHLTRSMIKPSSLATSALLGFLSQRTSSSGGNTPARQRSVLISLLSSVTFSLLRQKLQGWLENHLDALQLHGSETTKGELEAGEPVSNTPLE